MRYIFGDYSLDTQRYELRRAGDLIPLGPQVFNVLAYLLAHRDRVVSRDELFARLWPDQFVTDDALGRCIRAARRALEDDAAAPRCIMTTRGRGYRFIALVQEQPHGPGEDGVVTMVPIQSIPLQLFRVLLGLWHAYGIRGAYQTRWALGEQLLSLAQHLQDLDLLLEAHHALWTTLLLGGELAAVQPHLEQGMQLYDPQRHHTHAALYSGHDPGVCCRMQAAHALWLLGYPDQAVASLQAALALAQQLAHPLSLTMALRWAAVLHHLRREVPLTQARAEAAMTMATDHGFPQQVLMAMPLRGWALAVSGQGEEGIAQIQQGLAAFRATGETRDRPEHLAMLAEASAQVGQTTEGLVALAKALATLDQSDMRLWEAELYRLRGELLLHQTVPQAVEAVACFERALDVARHQQARSWELRAAMSLVRLWQRQGKRLEAHQLLVEVYGWFTEGFDTTDLQEAKALLEELGA